MSFQGLGNIYRCRKCGGLTVTIDVDEGVTPFLLDCRASGAVDECDGAAYSTMYPQRPWPPEVPEPAWEWYRPTENELRGVSHELRDHARAGGLFIRPKVRA